MPIVTKRSTAPNARLWTPLTDPLGQARRYIRIPKGTLNTQGGAKFITELRRLVGAWKSHLSAAHHCDVWPVVIIDPIQRFQETSRGEVEALGDLIEALGSVPMDGRFRSANVSL